VLAGHGTAGFVAAKYQFAFTGRHVPWSKNSLADAISWNSISKAFSVSPKLEQAPDHIPAAIVRFLNTPNLDWTSDAFRQQFLACFQPE
jgi:hypothetical protein